MMFVIKRNEVFQHVLKQQAVLVGAAGHSLLLKFSFLACVYRVGASAPVSHSS